MGSRCRPRHSALADGRRQAGRRRPRSPASCSVFANTPAKSLIIENGRIKGVVTDRGTIMADHVVVCAGLWGRLIAEMVGEDLPVMPVDHPLTFFGPYNEFAGTGKEIGYPLLRDQGNSAYMRDTGDPKTAEGGQIEWGYYEETNPRLVPSARPAGEARGAPVAVAARPRHGADHRAAGAGDGADADPRRTRLQRGPLLQRPAAGHRRRRPVDAARARRCAASGTAVAIWVKDGPGYGKLIADWMTDGRTADRPRPHRLCPLLSAPAGRKNSSRAAATRRRRRSTTRPCTRASPTPRAAASKRSPFYEREKELGGYFMELGGWERAHGYAANEHLLEKYGDRVPVRENEWDNRHFWRVSNAEHLAMSEDCGIVNLSHFHMVDIEGPDHVELMEWLCAAKIGGDANIGKGIYTHFLDDEGMVRADFTVIRMADRCRLIERRRCRPARLPLHAARRAGPRLRRHHHRRRGEVRHHRHLGAERPRHAEEGRRGPGRARRRRTSPSPRSSRSRSAARTSPPSASPMSASRAGNCT